LKNLALLASAATALVCAASLIATPAASQQAYGPGPGYASSTNLAGGYANSPGYAYGPGPGPAYGPGPGPGYAYGPGPGPGYAYGPPHELGGPARNGKLCWSDRDPWANTGQGYWKPC
jgi:hypothetical protein